MAYQREQSLLDAVRAAAKDVVAVHERLVDLQKAYDALGGKPAFDAFITAKPQDVSSDELYGAIVSITSSALSAGDATNFYKVRSSS